MHTWYVPVPFDAEEREALLRSYLNLEVPAERQIAAFMDDSRYGYGTNNDKSSVALHKLLTGQKLIALLPHEVELQSPEIYTTPYNEFNLYAGLYRNRRLVEYAANANFSGEKEDVIRGIVFGYPTIHIVEFLIKEMMRECINQRIDLDTEVYLKDFQRGLFIMFTEPKETEEHIRLLGRRGGRVEDIIRIGPRDRLYITLDQGMVDMCYQNSIEQLNARL